MIRLLAKLFNKLEMSDEALKSSVVCLVCINICMAIMEIHWMINLYLSPIATRTMTGDFMADMPYIFLMIVWIFFDLTILSIIQKHSPYDYFNAGRYDYFAISIIGSIFLNIGTPCLVMGMVIINDLLE